MKELKRTYAVPAYLWAGITIILSNSVYASSSSNVTCESLAGTTIPALSIGLATNGAKVTTATIIPSDKSKSGVEYCLVSGEIFPYTQSQKIHAGSANEVVVKTPSIHFEVALPTVWNHKTLQYGGGGFDGTVPPVDRANTSIVKSALARGYATLGSDSGHKAPYAGGDIKDLWNDEAIRNFGRQQIKKTHDAADFIISLYYHASPQHSYFQGGSQGGHEALIAAQFYPQDFDGVIAGYPAYDVEAMHLGSMDYSRALYNARKAGVDGYHYSAKAGEGWISRAQTRAISQYMMNTCDGKGSALDGVSDGMISDGGACHQYIQNTLHKNLLAHNDTNPLRCVGGVHKSVDPMKQDQELCLSDPQIETLARITSRFNFPKGLVLNGGLKSYGKWPMLDGIYIANDDKVNLTGQEDFGSKRNAYDAFQSTFPSTDQYNIITQQLHKSPKEVLEKFDPAQWIDRITTLSSWIDTSSVDYSAFRGRGGKLIHYHGASDVSITPYNSIDLYLRMTGQFRGNKQYLGSNPFWGTDDAKTNDTVSQNTDAAVSGGIVDGFYSFYLIPGFGHGHGYYNASVDWLSALERWVEQGVAPQNSLVSIDVSKNRLGSRPVCYFPYYPQYVGKASGNKKDAENYECRKLTKYKNLM